MNYKIVEKEGFAVVGKKTEITTANGENFKQVPEFWERCMKDGSSEWMCSKAGKLGVMGVCTDLHNLNEGFFSCMIAIEEINEPLPEGYVNSKNCPT